MAQYSRPAITRTYDAIHADISEATDAIAHIKADGVEFWRAQAEGCERLVNLWNEIVFQAVDDKKLPRWTRFAAITTRDDYARLARDARREAGELDDQLAECPALAAVLDGSSSRAHDDSACARCADIRRRAEAVARP